MALAVLLACAHLVSIGFVASAASASSYAYACDGVVHSVQMHTAEAVVGVSQDVAETREETVATTTGSAPSVDVVLSVFVAADSAPGVVRATVVRFTQDSIGTNGTAPV